MRLRGSAITVFLFVLLSLHRVEAVSADAGLDSVLMVSAWDSQTRVWRVFATGAVTPVLDLKSGEKLKEGWYGSGGAIASRNQQYAAYTWRNDLWIIDVHSGKKMRVTTVGEPQTSTLASTSAHPILWSWGGSRVLYQVVPGDTHDPEGHRAPLRLRKARYGTYVFEISTGRSISVPKLEGYPLHWLPDDSVLIHLGNRLYQRGIKNEKPSQLERFEEVLPQLSVAPDGNQMLANLGRVPSWSQIARIDLSVDPWRVTPLSPRGKFTEFQWPRFSPSGKRYAYVRNIGVPGAPNFELLIAERSIYTYTHATYAWINDEVLALQERESARTTSIVVINADSGRKIGSREFSKEK